VSDLVLIGLKTTANDQFPPLLPPLVGPTTAILTLQNGLGNEEQLAQLFPAEQIMGGLCFVCLNRVAPGTVHHLDHGRIVLGEFRRKPLPRTHQIASMFAEAHVSCEVTDDLARSHWEKLIWNIPFNGLGVAAAAGYEAVNGATPLPSIPQHPCLSTEQLLGEPRWEKLVRELMGEVIATANALGFSVPASKADDYVRRTRSMGAYKASTLIDFERRQPLELEALFLAPLRYAQRVGVPTPRLATLCSVLSHLNPPSSTCR
jgi:2-dehydropantoate 2-reductase